jgi:hypothetical protein
MKNVIYYNFLTQKGGLQNEEETNDCIGSDHGHAGRMPFRMWKFIGRTGEE